MSDKKQDPRVRRTRVALQNALLQLLQHKRLEKIHIKEIVAQADLSRHAFYSHFASKEELLFSYFDDVFEKINRAVFEDFNQTGQVDLLLLFTQSFKQWKHHAETLSYVMQVKNKDLVLARLRIHTAIIFDIYLRNKHVKIAKHKMYDFIVDYVSGGGYMVLQRWLEEDMQTDPTQLAQLIYQIVPLDSLTNHA